MSSTLKPTSVSTIAAKDSEAEAKAVAEDDPEIDRIEHRRGAAADIEAVGQRADIDEHADDAARMQVRGIHQHVDEEAERDAAVDGIGNDRPGARP